MDQEVINLIEENNKLLKENLELSHRNTKKIKKIHSYMRRTFIARIIYWFIIILVTAGALYAAKPYVEGMINSYHTLQEQITSTTEVVNNPSSLFKDIDIAEQILKIFNQK